MSKLFSLLLAAFCSSLLVAQVNPEFCEQIDALNLIIKNEHISPKPINDSLSKGVYHLFLSSLDSEKMFFTLSDIQEFKKDEYSIDDYIFSKDCSFIDKYIAKLEYRINFAKDIIENQYENTYDYTGKDTLRFSPIKEFKYYETEDEIKNYWNKNIRFNLILKLIEDDSIYKNIEKNFIKLEKLVKPKIIQNQICILEELTNQSGGLDKYVKELFLNAYSMYQDPNTNFFNYSENELFEQSLSGDHETFGISTQKNDDGEIVIASIAVGSNAFRNPNIEENDIIKSLTSGNNILEIHCVSNFEVTAFLNNSNNKTILFKIKKKDGKIKDVKLSKSNKIVEENLTRAYIISKTEKIGYIKIPSFYTDFESPNGLGVANDVAKELIRLNKENVSGLIIDLRFNGGGSLKEASDLSGLFINRGPLSILKYNTGETFTVRDQNRGVTFTEPIVIIVNHYSASASEYFASAMQDYNRAIIVGSSTYGKSSGQIILPLNETKNQGYCKVTTDKFYRVTGASNQSIGLQPDIKFNSTYDGLEISEAFSKYAFSADSVTVTLKAEKLKNIPIEVIKSNSFKRMQQNKNFQLLSEINQILINDYLIGKKEIPIALETIYFEIIKYNKLWEGFINHFDTIKTSITSTNTAKTNEYLDFNTDEKTINKILLKEISERSYDDMEAYIMAREMADKKMAEAQQDYEDHFYSYAEKYGIDIIENESDLGKKMTIAGEVFDHYNEMYLIFFKVNINEIYLWEAVNKSDIGAIQQNANSLNQAAKEGKEVLKNVNLYKNDDSLVKSTNDIFDYYINETENMLPQIIDFLILNEEFEAINTSFENTPEKKRTKKQVDAYNKKVNELNKAVKNYNKITNTLNTESQKVVNKYNQSNDTFLSRHIPKDS